MFQFGVSSTIVGLVFLCTSVFYTISSPIVGYMSDRLVSNFFLSFSNTCNRSDMSKFTILDYKFSKGKVNPYFTASITKSF